MPDRGINGRLRSHLISALRAVVLQHAALNCGIIDENSQNPAFVRLKQLDLTKHLDLRFHEDKPSIPRSILSDKQNRRMEHTLSDQHRHFWRNLATRPAWKLMVVVQTDTMFPAQLVVDVSFIFHHALIDGLSGILFHKSLLDALNSTAPNPTASDYLIKVPETLTLPPPVEHCLDLRVTFSRLILEFLNEQRPAWTRSMSSPWTGSPAYLLEGTSFVSHVRFFEINELHLRSLLQKCKIHNTTLTTLLHGIIVHCLSDMVPNAKSFVATTPYSVRNFSDSSSDDLVNQISVVTNKFSRRTMKSMTGHRNGLDFCGFVKLGSQFQLNLRKARTEFPANSTLSFLRFVPDFHEFFREKLGKSRNATYEVSNISVFQNPKIDSHDEEKWSVSRLLFTQAGSVVGNALSFNVASVKDGMLTVSLTWQDGAVDTNLAERLRANVQEYMVFLAT